MNVMLTAFCNRKCSYCFASKEMSRYRNKRENTEMSPENLNIVIKFLKKSGITDFRMIGGEPTLYSRFKEIYNMISDSGFTITIFTNGIFDKNKRIFLSQKENLNILLNVNHPKDYIKGMWKTVLRTIIELNEKITLGFNIYKIDFNPHFLLDLIEKYKIHQRKIRLGIANPILSGNNVYIDLKDHRKIANRIVNFSRQCNKLDITLSFDCGFVLCAFTKEQLGELYYNVGSVPKTNCSAPIDVAPDLKLFYCFSLSDKSDVKLTDFKDISEIKNFFEDKFKAFKRIGGMERCFNCKYLKRQQCIGGCISHTLRSLH